MTSQWKEKHPASCKGMMQGLLFNPGTQCKDCSNNPGIVFAGAGAGFAASAENLRTPAGFVEAARVV